MSQIITQIICKWFTNQLSEVWSGDMPLKDVENMMDDFKKANIVSDRQLLLFLDEFFTERTEWVGELNADQVIKEIDSDIFKTQINNILTSHKLP